MLKINIGKNTNFKCSQTLSLTALKEAINRLLEDSSKVKCNKVPNKILKIIDAICNFFINLIFK